VSDPRKIKPGPPGGQRVRKPLHEFSPKPLIPGLDLPFPSTPELNQAIWEAQEDLIHYRACASGPFWDTFSGWAREFDSHLERMIKLRSEGYFEACEYLEDLLVALHDHRSQIMRVTTYQILLNLPPMGRRNSLSDLEAITPSILRRFLSEANPRLIFEALSEDSWPPSVRQWVVGAMQEIPSLQCMLSLDTLNQPNRLGKAFGPRTTELLGKLVHTISEARSLLSIPSSWIGASCLDLRIQKLSTLASDHLAAYPEMQDLSTALAGLSIDNHQRVLDLLPEQKASAIQAFQGSGLHKSSWGQVVLAQRRISWWVRLVDFWGPTLDAYEILKHSALSDEAHLRDYPGVPDRVRDQLVAMVKVYRG
jgi:hypothetical protein